MSLLIYTLGAFRKFAKPSGDVFVFSKLKEDLARFEQRLDTEKPDYILGIAITKGLSRIEPLAINKFNKGKVLASGSDSFELFVPQHYPTEFGVATKPTHSFCNWTMYRVQSLLLEKGYRTKFVFVHVSSKDIDKLKGLVKSWGSTSP